MMNGGWHEILDHDIVDLALIQPNSPQQGITSSGLVARKAVTNRQWHFLGRKTRRTAISLRLLNNDDVIIGDTRLLCSLHRY